MTLDDLLLLDWPIVIGAIVLGVALSLDRSGRRDRPVHDQPHERG